MSLLWFIIGLIIGYIIFRIPVREIRIRRILDSLKDIRRLKTPLYARITGEVVGLVDESKMFYDSRYNVTRVRYKIRTLDGGIIYENKDYYNPISRKLEEVVLCDTDELVITCRKVSGDDYAITPADIMWFLPREKALEDKYVESVIEGLQANYRRLRSDLKETKRMLKICSEEKASLQRRVEYLESQLMRYSADVNDLKNRLARAEEREKAYRTIMMEKDSAIKIMRENLPKVVEFIRKSDFERAEEVLNKLIPLVERVSELKAEAIEEKKEEEVKEVKEEEKEKVSPI